LELAEHEVFSATNCIGLLTKVLEFRFRPELFGQDYTEWETLKARFEKQTGAALPDSILVASLLNRTAGPLQQHLRLNVRTMGGCDLSYDTVRDVITAFLPIKTCHEQVCGPAFEMPLGYQQALSTFLHLDHIRNCWGTLQ
jgi:hypothetical protein